MTQNNDVGATQPIVFRCNEPAALGFYTERLEKSAGHLTDLELNRFAGSGVIQWLGHHAPKAAEASGLRLHIYQIRGRLVRTKSHQSGWILVRQRAQQDSVDDTEDCSVHTDTQCECDHGDCSKPGSL